MKNPSSQSDILAWTCAALCGERPPWPDPERLYTSDDGLIAFWNYHDVVSLLYVRLRAMESGSDHLPESLRERITRIAKRAVAYSLLQQDETTSLLHAAATRGLRGLILKGTALAFSLYPRPSLRPRGDLDLLVSPDNVDAWHELLTEGGFTPPSANEGALISRERAYSRQVTPNLSFSLDLHWGLNNSPLLTQSAPSFDQLWERSVSLAALGTEARGLSWADALLMACIHRAGHRYAPYYSDGVAYLGGNRLIWLYDIHLLAQKLSPLDWDELLGLSRAMRVCAVCADALEVAAQHFGTLLPAAAMGELRAVRAGELSAAFIRGSPLAIKLAEFRVLPSLGLKIRWLREHLFPATEYTLRKYGYRNPVLLPWLYLRRIGGGALKLMAHRSGSLPGNTG